MHARILAAACAVAFGLAGQTPVSIAKTGASRSGGVYKTNFNSGGSKSVVRTVRRVRKRARISRRWHGAYRPGMNACRVAAARFGVPVSTALAVCRLESGFRCSAVGRAGELGLLQIKLSTARGLGYRGSRRGLLGCATGAYWGMKHLALAIRRGGVWKHNQGLGARRPTASARSYARKVAALRRRYR